MPIGSAPGIRPIRGTTVKITIARDISIAATTSAIRSTDSHNTTRSICRPTIRKINALATNAKYSQKCSINSDVLGEIFDLPHEPMVMPAATTAMMPLT